MQKICGFFCWESQVPGQPGAENQTKDGIPDPAQTSPSFFDRIPAQRFLLICAPLPSGPEAEVPLPVRLPRGLPLAPGPLYRHRTAAGFPLLPQGGRQVFHLSVLGGLGAKLHPRLRPRRL